MKIPITRCVFDADDREMLLKPLETGWVVQGPFVNQFEQEFAGYTGSAYAIASTSCTTAMHLCLAALGIQPGDEVLVPAFTWVATANAVEYLGATPIFCDIDLATFNISPGEIGQKISSSTKALMPVHLFGLAADLFPIIQTAELQGLTIIEDAACGFGARYRNKHVGTFGKCGCFSFHPRKAITTGEGGMIVTEDEQFAALCRTLRDHGASRSDLIRHQGKDSFRLAEYNHLGYNFRMTDFQGALGVSQMRKAAAIQASRISCAVKYDRMLELFPWLRTPAVPEGCEHSYQSHVCLFAPEEPSWSNLSRFHGLRNELMAGLEELGVATRPGTHAAALLGYYRGKYNLKPEMFPNAWFAEQLSISLPLYAGMTDEEQGYVVQSIGEVFSRLRV